MRGRTGATADSAGRGGRRLVRAVARDRWPVLLAGVLVALVWRAGLIAAPLLVQHAVDAGITGGDRATLQRTTIALAALGVATALLGAARHSLAAVIGYGTEAALRARLVDHLGALPAEEHDRRGRGALLGHATSDLEAVEPMAENLPTNVANLAFIAVVATLLAVRHPELAGVAAVPLVLLVLAVAAVAPRLRAASRRAQHALGQVHAEAQETVLGIRVVKGLGAERVRTAGVAGAAGRARDAGITAARWRAVGAGLSELLPGLAALLVVVRGAGLAATGQVTVGALLEVLAYLALLAGPVRQLPVRAAVLARGLAAADRIADLLAVPPAPVGSLTAGRPGPAALAVQGLRLRRGGRLLLEDVDLAVPAGATLGVVGPTGAGKSLLLQALGGVLRPDAGEVHVGGVPVAELTDPARARAVQLVPAVPVLFATSVAENLRLGAPEAADDQLWTALEAAGLADVVRSLPRGLDTRLGTGGTTLSGGQRQRLAVARALMCHPAVLLLDDVTAALDATTEARVVRRLLAVPATTVVVSSRPATLADLDAVVVLEHGRVVARGSHHDLVRQEAGYRRLLGAATAAVPR